MNHPCPTRPVRIWHLVASLLGALAFQPLAQAGAGDLQTVVTPLQANVTYSDPTARVPLATYIGYTVRIANAGGNTINNIRFTGATVVTDAQEKATFASVEGGSCTADATGTAIECPIGQLKAGEAFPAFTVFFKAPAKDTVSPTPDGSDLVVFSGVTFYAEGTGGINSVPDNSLGDWTTAPVLLGTPNPTVVKSAVQKTGGTFFTGAGALTTPADPVSTTVVVPAGTTFTTAEVQETSTIVGCSVLTTCYTSDITVPGTFSPYLQIVLRLDALAVPNGTKIGSILISYDGTVIGDCASPTTVTGTGIPCIASKKTYPKNSKNGKDFPVELEGDFEWTLINTKNGSLKIF